MSTHLPFLACWENPKPVYFPSLNIPFERRLLLRVLLDFERKKDCSCYALQSPISLIVRLVLCFFDFRDFFCRYGYNLYTLIAYTVQQFIQL